jgi:hypothetical protein
MCVSNALCPFVRSDDCRGKFQATLDPLNLSVSSSQSGPDMALSTLNSNTPSPSEQQGLYRIMASFGMLHRVVLVRTDVSEELSASIIRVTRISELGTTLAVTSNRRTLRSRFHCTSHSFV